MVDLRFDPKQLQPLFVEVARAVLEEASSSRALLLNGKMALTEPEAADLLGLNPWQLRDLRLEGKISFHRIVGNRIRYTVENLQGYLNATLQPGTE